MANTNNTADKDGVLNIRIFSFSYLKGIPEDPSGNGGGYVFDCRGILNPGRIEEYKTQTGRDQSVIDYLESKTEMPKFFSLAKQIVDITLTDYLARDFSNLQISFGCTGGQHRSVYSADAMAKYIQENYEDVHIILNHREQEAKNWINKKY